MAAPEEELLVSDQEPFFSIINANNQPQPSTEPVVGYAPRVLPGCTPLRMITSLPPIRYRLATMRRLGLLAPRLHDHLFPVANVRALRRGGENGLVASWVSEGPNPDRTRIPTPQPHELVTVGDLPPNVRAILPYAAQTRFDTLPFEMNLREWRYDTLRLYQVDAEFVDPDVEDAIEHGNDFMEAAHTIVAQLAVPFSYLSVFSGETVYLQGPGFLLWHGAYIDIWRHPVALTMHDLADAVLLPNFSIMHELANGRRVPMFDRRRHPECKVVVLEARHNEHAFNREQLPSVQHAVFQNEQVFGFAPRLGHGRELDDDGDPRPLTTAVFTVRTAGVPGMAVVAAVELLSVQLCATFVAALYHLGGINNPDHDAGPDHQPLLGLARAQRDARLAQVGAVAYPGLIGEIERARAQRLDPPCAPRARCLFFFDADVGAANSLSVLILGVRHYVAGRFTALTPFPELAERGDAAAVIIRRDHFAIAGLYVWQAEHVDEDGDAIHPNVFDFVQDNYAAIMLGHANRLIAFPNERRYLAQLAAGHAHHTAHVNPNNRDNGQALALREIALRAVGAEVFPPVIVPQLQGAPVEVEGEAGEDEPVVGLE